MPIVYRVTGPNETQLALRRGLRPQPIPRATKFATGVRRGIHFFTTLDEAREVAQSISEDVPSTTFTVITLDLPTLATSVPDLNWNIPPEDPVDGNEGCVCHKSLFCQKAFIVELKYACVHSGLAD